MKIERHVFGSFKGYTTLSKSDGMSTEDSRQLEGAAYGFGQTEDLKYLKSLRSSPAYFTRVLRVDRRGLTRVLSGHPDDNGRPTLLMMTAVLSANDWNNGIWGDISLLLNDAAIWKWQGEPTMAPLDRTYRTSSPTLSSKLAMKVASLISEIERRYPASSPIVVSADEFSYQEMEAIEALIPPMIRPQFTSACRSLSPQLSVTLNQLAPEAPAQKVNFQYNPSLPRSAYAEYLLARGLAQGRLPLGHVLTYRDFGRVRSEAVTASVMPVQKERTFRPPPPPKRKGRLMIPTAVTAAILLAFGGGFLLGQKMGVKKALLAEAKTVNTATRPVDPVIANSPGERPVEVTVVLPATQPATSALSTTQPQQKNEKPPAVPGESKHEAKPGTSGAGATPNKTTSPVPVGDGNTGDDVSGEHPGSTGARESTGQPIGKTQSGPPRLLQQDTKGAPPNSLEEIQAKIAKHEKVDLPSQWNELKNRPINFNKDGALLQEMKEYVNPKTNTPVDSIDQHATTGPVTRDSIESQSGNSLNDTDLLGVLVKLNESYHKLQPLIQKTDNSSRSKTAANELANTIKEFETDLENAKKVIDAKYSTGEKALSKEFLMNARSLLAEAKKIKDMPSNNKKHK